MRVAGYNISTERNKLDRDVIHEFLSEKSYWCPGIPRSIVDKSIKNSLCSDIYHEKNQVAFARVVSDFSTFALIADVFVLKNHRSKGLSKWLMLAVMEHPDLQNLRRLLLLTSDAHSLYRKF